jgi:DUF3046 family protein
MRSSEFWALVDDEFGRARGRALVHELVLIDLGNRTAEQAIADGVPNRAVWFALCAAMDVPPERRWGREEQPGAGARNRR